MASFMNAADIIAAAVEIERRGHGFYTAAEKQAEDPKDKNLFALMASEERNHEYIFSEMLARQGGLALPAGATNEEYLSYIHGLLDSHILFVNDSLPRMLENPLHEAMRLEKDSLLFFLEMQALVPGAEQARIRACANEERKHLNKLARRKATKDTQARLAVKK